MSSKEVRVRAIRFVQNSRVFYAAAMPAGKLIELCKVDVWHPEDPADRAGYQRAPSLARKRQVAEYAERSDAILPEGGFVNVRPPAGVDEPAYGGALQFAADESDGGQAIQSGWLTIPAEAGPLYIVDMQHRLGGIQVAIGDDNRTDLQDFPMLVTIGDGLSRLEEVEQFELINTAQKKVRTDLARRLMAIQMRDADRRLSLDRRGKLWEARGPMIANWLNTHDGVWEAAIMPPNKRKKECPGAIVPETSFVTSLKPILQTPLFMRLPEDQAAEIIGRFWSAVAMVFREAFEHPADYVIQKTPGIYPLHALAPEVFELVRSKGRDLTVQNLQEELQPLEEVGSDFWHRESDDGASRFGSMKGFRILAAELRAHLPELAFEEV